jgi:DtxR family transcriptional regulator, Mn-dependent transcriptional regulator
MSTFPDPLTSLLVAALLAALGLLFFLPERGLLPRWRRTRQLNERVLLEDALKHLHRSETHDRHATLPSLAGALNVSMNRAAHLLEDLQARGLVITEGETFRLTPEGRDYALRIIRAHRLWEEHLAEQTGFSEAEWHDQAEVYEHLLSEQETKALAEQLGNPTHDPHGDPIPTPEGEFRHHAGQPLTGLPVDTPLRIVHIEDEPETVYAQLVAEGLFPGMSARITESSPQRIRLWAGGDEHILAPVVAANVSAVPLVVDEAAAAEHGLPLSDLHSGEQGRVLALSPRFRGAERRRMLDLGILPGTLIEREMTSPSGDPTAYRIRGALIALRREQAQGIRIEKMDEVLQV